LTLITGRFAAAMMPVGTTQAFFYDAFPDLSHSLGVKCQTQDKYWLSQSYRTPSNKNRSPERGEEAAREPDRTNGTGGDKPLAYTRTVSG